MKIKIIIVTLCFGLVVTLKGNPMIDLSSAGGGVASKQNEVVFVVARPDQSFVSIEIAYNIDWYSDIDQYNKIHLAVPVFVPKDFVVGDVLLKNVIFPYVKLDDTIYFHKEVALFEDEYLDISIPENLSVALFGFTFNLKDKPDSKKFYIFYNQPMIDGLFLYLPQFEEGGVHGSARLFMLTDRSQYHVRIDSSVASDLSNEDTNEIDLKDRGLVRITLQPISPSP